MMKIKRQLGKFTITYELIEDERDIILSAFYSIGFLPIEVKSDYSKQAIVYIGTSPKFSEMECGASIPAYEILRSDINDGEPTFEVKLR